MTISIYFSDFFDVSPDTLEEYGAFNVSLINDLPLFIDPFLLFNSTKPEYSALHDSIIAYVRFLKAKSVLPGIHDGLGRIVVHVSRGSAELAGVQQTGQPWNRLRTRFRSGS